MKLERSAVLQPHLLLARLDLESDGPLLALDAEERKLWCERLRDHAWKALRDVEVEAADREQMKLHPLLLAEAAFEGHGRLADAAAFYALAHDEQLASTAPVARYERAVLRFKLGHGLWQLDESCRENTERCIQFCQATLRQADRLWKQPGISKDAFFSLIFELQSWLGHRQEGLGRYQEAADAYSQASIAARSLDDRVAYSTRMASALAELGERQKAYELLLLDREDVAKVEDPEVRQLWEAVYSSLRLELGGEPGLGGKRIDIDAFQDLAEILQRLLREDAMPPPEKLQRAVAFLRQALQETPEEEAAARHPLLTSLSVALFALGQRDEAKAALQQAEQLEALFLDEPLKLRRRFARARQLFQSGRREVACVLFLALLPDAKRHWSDEERLTLHGHCLEALGASGTPPDKDQLCDLVDEVLRLFHAELERQPGTAARRRVREMHQRALEGALVALLAGAERAGIRSDLGQALLRQAWNVVLSTRNVELSARVAPANEEVKTHLRQLEERFHEKLRLYLAGQPIGRGEWMQPLDEVVEYELAVAGTSAVLPSAVVAPAPEGVAVAFFQVRDLFARQPLVVLGWEEGKLRFHAIEDFRSREREVWRDLPTATSDSRAFVYVLPVSPDEKEKRELSMADLLPPDVSLLRFRRVAAPGGGRSLLHLRPWFLFPDGRLHALPFEMLADLGEGETCFGEDRPVQLCLRSTSSVDPGSQVDLARGWLGLGGIPPLGNLAALPQSREEVLRIQDQLLKKGHPAKVLIGADASSDRLEEELKSLRPAVLHIATHGYADAEHPDACCLLLADCPSRPERELLPFRRIQDLDLRGVDLVVLSACSSLQGRSSRGAGMEGLAWAFLQAGAARVIASRWPVGDGATAQLMAVLYAHLQEVPIAEALGRARRECQRDLHLERTEVGAWAVWS
jgi:tetratricopeptide (TPR) repeat protein